MRTGRASNTAQFVALNRALADLAPEVEGFSDPTAVELLSPRWRRVVERSKRRRHGSPYPFWVNRGMAVYNQFRTVVLDDAICDSQPAGQLVILGAGLDDRAYRLPCLGCTSVFEVDHPDTQAIKSARTAALTPAAHSLDYVAVDFGHDDLGHLLLAAGFDAGVPTMWIWEGVTMYLSAAEVEATMTASANLSAPGSRLALTYFDEMKPGAGQKAFLALFGLLTGEPVRSTFSTASLSQLAARTGWTTTANSGLEDWMPRLKPGSSLSPRDVGIQKYERVWQGRIVGPA